MAQAGCLKHLCCSFLSMCHNSVPNVAFRFLLRKSFLEEPRLLQNCLLNRLCSTSSKGEDSASKQVPELSNPDSPDRAAEPVKQNTERTKQRKLHNRVLSKEVKGELRSFRKSLSSFPEADLFGILGKEKENCVCEEKTKLKIEKTECGKVRREASSNMGKHLESQKRILTEGEKDAENQIEKRQQHLSLRRHAAFKIRGNRRNKAESWTDTFGTLQEDNLEDRIAESLLSDLGTHEERLSDYEDDKKSDRSHIRLSATNRRHIPMWYGRKIAKLAKRGRIREAIQLFEEQMLQEDRVKPDAYVFTSLIAGLGHAGYTAKAFKLFNKMKKMAVEPIPHTYTALFNACANSPWKHDGLQRAEHLRQLMQEKEIEPTLITGKAMIKAFGICGDLHRAFSIMDQLSQSFRLDQEAFSSLLMACVADKQAGLRFAIQVWRLMQQMGVRPDLPLYNLLLRCVRDCGVGEVATVEDLLGKTTHSAKSKEQERVISAKDEEALLLPPMMRSSEEAGGGCDPHHTVSSTVSARHAHQDLDSQAGFENRISLLDYDSTDLCTDASQRRLLDETTEQLPGFCHGASVLPRKDTFHAACSVSIPDLLSPTSSTAGVAALGDLSSRESRVALLGGTDGILERMKADRVQPDIRTFSQLVTVAMPTLNAEKKLLMEMARMKVKPDVDFFNMLMQKRIARRDLMAAREVRQLIVKHKLIANIRTYGILAMTCCSEQEGLELLKDMEEAEVQPNIEILGTLMRASQLKFGYKLKVLQVVQKLDLSPNPVFLQHIESSLAHARQRMVEVETKKEEESYLLSKGFQRNMERFEQHYEEWLSTVKVERPPHPWASFKPKQLADDDELVVSRG